MIDDVLLKLEIAELTSELAEWERREEELDEIILDLTKRLAAAQKRIAELERGSPPAGAKEVA